MMSEKKGNLRQVLLIFFIVQFILALFVNNSIHIGTHPDTQKFSVWMEKPAEKPKMQTQIAEEIQPDKFREEAVKEMKIAFEDSLNALQTTLHAKIHTEEVNHREREQFMLNLVLDRIATWDDYHAQVDSMKARSDARIDDLQKAYDLQAAELTAKVSTDTLAFNHSFTYNSGTLFRFFSKLFTEGSAFKVFGTTSAITNFHLWRMLLYLDIFIILLALYVRKKLSFIPSIIQIVFEFLYTFLEDLIVVTLGEKKARTFIPFFITLFIFIWFSNWSALLPIPGINEPTRNLNVPLGLGLMSLTVVHFCSMRKKGVFNYIKGYCEPIVFMMPLNVIGEVSKVISISFRLFGNIFGGAIITIVVSALTYYVIVPVGLNMFFTMFAGTIQAFVFTMLSLTYLSLEIVD